ncbi:hypothetical protein BHE74_00021769 [Ensete ventricosum]|nr:hypothetical protein BHE74_00021769 [Ensete ventricosum]
MLSRLNAPLIEPAVSLGNLVASKKTSFKSTAWGYSMSRNAPVFKKWLNQQRNHSFSASRAAFTDSNLAVVDVDNGRANRGLLAKIEDDHGGCRSLTKFLRYNPINEFEQPFFKSLGLKPSEMNSILVLSVQHPQILNGKFMRKSWQSVQLLAEIGMTIDDTATILSSHAHVLGSCSYKKPDVLESLNLSAERLCEIIKKDPRQFSVLLSSKNVDNLPKFDGNFLQEKTKFLLKLGFVENSDEMAKEHCKFRGRGDQPQERFDCLVNAGLDGHTVSEMIKSVPTIINLSVDLIKKKIGYLLNHLGYPLESLVVFPTFLCYDMEKMKLRFSMYFWLKERVIVIHTNKRKMVNIYCSLEHDSGILG